MAVFKGTVLEKSTRGAVLCFRAFGNQRRPPAAGRPRESAPAAYACMDGAGRFRLQP